jgi:hypothetical protein
MSSKVPARKKRKEAAHFVSDSATSSPSVHEVFMNPAILDEVTESKTEQQNDIEVRDLQSAATRLNISVKTLRKKCVNGEVLGATKADYTKGARWVIPVTTLEAIERESALKATSAPLSPVKEIEALKRQLEATESELEATKTMLQAQTVRADAHEQIALERLARIEDLKELHSALTGAVRALTVKSESRSVKWWRRSSQQVPPNT